MIVITRFRWPCVLVLLSVAPACLYLDHNFRAVEKGAFYRSGQLDDRHLSAVIAEHSIATVINLRGSNPEQKWYQSERRVCADHGVVHHDLRWSKDKLPTPESLAQFLAWVDTSEQPILVHCQGGIHRTGVASACYLLHHGADLDTARGQLGIFFGDAPIGQLLGLYEGSPLSFSEWVRTEYPEVYEQATE